MGFNSLHRFLSTTDDIEKSIELAKKIEEKYADAASLTFVGFSKGGAEAAANALATKGNAILFNPATLRYPTKYGLSLEDCDDKITSYIINGEALSKTDGRFGDGLFGKKIYVGEENKLFQVLSIYSLLCGYAPSLLTGIFSSIDSISRHGLSNFVDTQK